MKNKGLIIIIVILIVYGGIMYFLFSKPSNDNFRNNTDSTKTNINNNTDIIGYLVINNMSYKYYNDKFDTASKGEIDTDNNNYINFDGQLIAGTQELNLIVKNINKKEISEAEKVYLINNFNIKSFNNLSVYQEAEIDLDYNGQIDKIICISSSKESKNKDSYYNLILVKLNDNYQTLLDERGDNAKYTFNIYSIINFLNKKVDSIVIEQINGLTSEEPRHEYIIYNYKNDKYVID